MPVLDTWKKHYWYSISCVRTRIEEIVRRAKGAYTVLDCGCNEGFLSKALLEAGFHVTSIDNDEAEIAKAWELFGIRAVKADVNDLPYVDGQFDLVIGGELMEHLDNPGAGLAEMFRVSKSRVMISLPIGEYWLGEATHKWQIDAEQIEHDHGLLEIMKKKILIIEFTKRHPEGEKKCS